MFICFLLCNCMIAQQEAIYTKFNYNSLYFNPAYAGSTEFGAGSVFAQGRQQWLGFEGAPETILIGAEASFFKDRVGLGLSFAKEEIGIDSRYDLSANYAYRMLLWDESVLAIGVRLGFNMFRADFSKIDNIVVNGPDPVYNGSNNQTMFSPGLGVYWNSELAYLGFAVPSLATISLNGESREFRKRHYYAHGGMMLNVKGEDIRLEPSALIKYQKAVPLQATLSANVWFVNTFAVGLGWRSDDAVALNFELFLKEKFRLAVAYDYTLSGLKDYTTGSLEVMLSYFFITNEKDRRSEAIRRGYKF